MAVEITQRDYSLVGHDAKHAVESGLASAEWYSCPIERKELKELMKRKDGPAIRDTVIWWGLLVPFGALGVLPSGSGWSYRPSRDSTEGGQWPDPSGATLPDKDEAFRHSGQPLADNRQQRSGTPFRSLKRRGPHSSNPILHPRNSIRLPDNSIREAPNLAGANLADRVAPP